MNGLQAPTLVHPLAAYFILGVGVFVAQAVISDWRGKPSALTGMKRWKLLDFILLAYAAASIWIGYGLYFAISDPKAWEGWAHFSWPILIPALICAILLIKRSALFWMLLMISVLGLWAVSYTVWGN